MTAEDVAYLVDQKLRPLGMLEGDDASVAAKAPPMLGLALRGGVMPSAIVLPITRLLAPLFASPVVLLSLLGLAAIDVRLLPGHHLGRAVREISGNPAMVLAIIGLTLLGGLLHELGHATGTHYGGATPGAIGVGIYLLWPVFYNDLNDSYRLNQVGRLRADLGGIYFNALFTVVVGAFYGISGAAPLLIVIVIEHLTIAQQCLPFVRLDGYYVLSDLIGVPDLFEHIRPILASLVPGRRAAAEVAQMKATARVVVTTWVLLTVPLLAGVAAFLLISLPSLLAVGYHSLAAHVTALGTAFRAGDVVRTFLDAAQMVVLAIPFVGVTALLARIAGRCWRLGRESRRRRRRIEPQASSVRRA
jgi:putative peptide zinc metalloprotease protein